MSCAGSWSSPHGDGDRAPASLRQLPYLRAWAGKYADHGLAMIGMHTPEFGFEHDLANVRRAVRDMRIDYPVAIDNDYTVWSAWSRLSESNR